MAMTCMLVMRRAGQRDTVDGADLGHRQSAHVPAPQRAWALALSRAQTAAHKTSRDDHERPGMGVIMPVAIRRCRPAGGRGATWHGHDTVQRATDTRLIVPDICRPWRFTEAEGSHGFAFQRAGWFIRASSSPGRA
jgi:hypothetical protein